MKKNLLLSLLFICCKAFSQSTYIQDTWFEQSLVEQGYDSTYDHYVLTENISSITSLTLTHPVQSLVGIEGFTSLVNLSVTYGGTTIDLSQNTALTSLTLNSGSQNLDLSQATNLTHLSISGSFQNLNLPNNSAITYLKISGDSLTSFDISNQLGLKELHFYGRFPIDVSANTQLKILEVSKGNQTPSAYNINLLNNPLLEEIKTMGYTNFDFSNNHLMKKISLSATPMTAIDVSAMPDLNYLSINTAMNLPAIDLTNNPLLATLIINYTGIQTIAMPASNTNLKTLQLENIPTALAQGLNLPAFPNLQTLIVNTTGFPYAFNFDVSHNTQLKKLDLDLFVLHLDLSQNTLLENLKTRCPINSLDLTHNSSLKILNLKSSAVTSLNLTQNLFLESLTLASSITNLDLRQNTAMKLLNFRDTSTSWGYIPNPYLHVIDLRNGHIELINQFLMPQNQPSYCILVDDINTPYIVNQSNGIFSNVYSHLTDNASQCALATVDQTANNTVSIYPNPTSSKLNLPDGLTFERIIISDLSGKKVMELQGISNEIDVEYLEKGMYIIRFLNGEKNMVSKFMKL